MAVSGLAINDAINATIPNVAAGGNDIGEKLRRWFQAGGATSNDLQDAERQFLVARGETERDTQDMWERYLRVTLGLGTLALDDLQYKYWGGNFGGTVGDSGFGVADISGLNLGPPTFVRATAGSAFSRIVSPYYVTNGGAGSYASTPSAPANQVTGNIAVIAKIAPVSWSPGALQTFISKWFGAQLAFSFRINTGGFLQFVISTTGADFPNASSSVAVPFGAGNPGYVAVTRNVADGATRFYTSADGLTWTQLGVTQIIAAGSSIFQSTAAVNIGSDQNGTSFLFNGKIFWAEVRNGGDMIASPVAFRFDVNDAAYRATSWVSKTGETWTLNQGGVFSGLVQAELMQIGAGFARSWCNPATGAFLGFRTDGQRTNLLLRSQDKTQAIWGKTDTTANGNALLAPDGTWTASQLVEGVAGTAVVQQNYTGTANATQSKAFWVKRSNHDWMFVAICEAATPANQVGVYINMNTGALGTVINGGTGTLAAATIETYPNGWYRVTLTGKVNNAATALATFTRSASADASAVRVNNGSRYDWGEHLEDNVERVSSYIPTVAATVTRNADVLSYANPPININVGTAVVTFIADKGNQGANQMVARFSDNTFNNAEVVNISNTGFPSFSTVAAGVFDGLAAGGVAVSDGVLTKIAAAWAANDLAVVKDGGAPGTDATWTIPAGLNRLDIGGDQAGTNHLFGIIQSVRYYPARLTNAQLQLMTA